MAWVVTKLVASPEEEQILSKRRKRLRKDMDLPDIV
jgi:hypothetical protein